MTDLSPDPRPDVDGLLRATMADDLPTAVEDRLNASVERFLADRGAASGSLVAIARRCVRVLTCPIAWHPVLRAAGCAALIVGGAAAHALVGPRVFAASVSRVQASVALWTAIGHATSMQCTGDARDDLRSPAEFAERVYRRWVLVDSRSDETGALLLKFLSPADFAQYDLHLDHRSMLPDRVVRRRLANTARSNDSRAGYDANCHWMTDASGANQ